MRIGIDAQFAAYQRRGIGRYVVNLVRGLAAADGENEYVIYGPPQAFPELRSKTNFRIREVGNVPYPLWEQIMLPAAVRRDGLDLLHCPANTAPLRMPRRVRLVVTLHDVIYLLPASVLPRPRIGRQRLGNLYRRAVVPRSCPRADRVLTVSEFTKKQIVEFLPVAPERIRVTYQGVEPVERAPEEPPSMEEPPFILALGAHDPRKNTERIIRAYAGLKRSGAIEPKLRIVGLRRWRSSSFYRLACDLKVERDILFQDYVPDAELARLYASARCFVYPSLYEGFGLPPLEAMLAGTPVIASAASSIPEVAGDVPVYVNPTSTESIQEALLKVLREPEMRASLLEQGRAQAARFRWETTAAQTLSAYQEAFHNHQ